MKKRIYTRRIILVFMSVLMHFLIFGQEKLLDRKLTEQIIPQGYLIIEIRHGSERYFRDEVNVVYFMGSALKIHSILKSNIGVEIDTSFVLNSIQVSLIDRFGDNFKNKDITSNEIWAAGTRTFYYLTLNHETKLFNNKSGYSLIRDLLEK